MNSCYALEEDAHFGSIYPQSPKNIASKYGQCDSETFYTWRMQVYLEKNGNATRKVNQGCSVVLDLVREIENSGKNIVHHAAFAQNF